jgi:hypothetical protein
MIIDAIECKDVIDAYLKLYPLQRLDQSLTVEDWEMLTQLCKILEKFDNITKTVSQKQPVISEGLEFYLFLYKLFNDVDLICDDKKDQIQIKFLQEIDVSIIKTLQSTRHKFDKYYEIILNSVVYATGSILDPRYKDFWLVKHHKSEEDRHTIMDKIKEYITDNYQAKSDDNTPDSQETDGNASEFGLFGSWAGMYEETGTKITELERYLQEKRIVRKSRDFEVLKWWCENGHEYPILAKVARDFLAIPLASVSVERLFNLGRDQLALRRHNLAAETLQQLMIIQYTERERRKQ